MKSVGQQNINSVARLILQGKNKFYKQRTYCKIGFIQLFCRQETVIAQKVAIGKCQEKQTKSNET